MYRSKIARVAGQVSSKRLAVVCRAQGKRLCRSYSASAGGQRAPKSGTPLHWTLGAAAALSAIYYVYPFERKPKEEAKVEAEADQDDEAQAEPEVEQNGEEQAEPGTVEEAKEPEKESQQREVAEETSGEQAKQPEESEAIEDNLAQPSEENTIVSSDSLQSSGKSIKSDEELQKVEEAQLEPTNQEAEREGAYNPDTGEINWDCPCLGGMAHGPCGEEFKLAFSCFVFSEAEPKGIDCVEKFQGMQECFRKYPDYYAEQLKDEEEAVAAREEKIEAAVAGEEARQGTKAVARLEDSDAKNVKSEDTVSDASTQSSAPKTETSSAEEKTEKTDV